MVDCVVNEMPKIGPPVFPYRGFRGIDPYGGGGFGAPRDGGTRDHPGLDFIGIPGDDGVAPFPGRIVRVGIAKSGTTLGSVHIQGLDDYWVYYAKIYYAKPFVTLGQEVDMGQRISVVQDMASYYHEQNALKPPEDQIKGEMQNHLHMFVRVVFDPARLLVELPCLP